VPELSIIIPSCNEIATTSEGENVLLRTVRDIYEKATGDFEVIVGFNGREYQDFPDYPNLRTLKLPDNIGLKPLVNVLAIMAKGKYLYKSDAHCSFGKSFDEILLADMQDNWLVMPRFYVLDAWNWKWQEKDLGVGYGVAPEFYDYFFLPCPFTDPRGFRFKAGGHWIDRTIERLSLEIDETPQFHGSGWMVNREFFLNNIGGFPTNDPYGHAQEPPNIGLKYWLGPWDGKVMVNKKTWYAHFHQTNQDKGYHYTGEEEKVSYDIWSNFWMGNKWGERIHDFDWFIERFPNMPTWPDDWRERYQQWLTQ
jgi:hypothetical protein